MSIRFLSVSQHVNRDGQVLDQGLQRIKITVSPRKIPLVERL